MEEKYKRARSAEAKADRKSTILAAARRRCIADGYDGLTMNAVAAEAGVVKGTLYLYFRSREELFLALFAEAVESWTRQVVPAITGGADDAALAERLAGLSREVPLFLALLARLAPVLQQNVPDAALTESKRMIFQKVWTLATAFAAARRIEPARAFEVMQALFLVLQGAAQDEASRHRIGHGLSEDVRRISEMSRFDNAFPAAARLILAGSRG